MSIYQALYKTLEDSWSDATGTSNLYLFTPMGAGGDSSDYSINYYMNFTISDMVDPAPAIYSVSLKLHLKNKENDHEGIYYEISDLSSSSTIEIIDDITGDIKYSLDIEKFGLVFHVLNEDDIHLITNDTYKITALTSRAEIFYGGLNGTINTSIINPTDDTIITELKNNSNIVLPKVTVSSLVVENDIKFPTDVTIEANKFELEELTINIDATENAIPGIKKYTIKTPIRDDELGKVEKIIQIDSQANDDTIDVLLDITPKSDTVPDELNIYVDSNIKGNINIVDETIPAEPKTVAKAEIMMLDGINTDETIQSQIDDKQTQIDEKAPINHASDTTDYGVADETNYGHVKLSDIPDESNDTTSNTAATPKAVSQLIPKVSTQDRTTDGVYIGEIYYKVEGYL